jgi:hypothetical protein
VHLQNITFFLGKMLRPLAKLTALVSNYGLCIRESHKLLPDAIPVLQPVAEKGEKMLRNIK